MNLGELSVTLTANVAAFQSSLKGGLEAIDKFGREAKRTMNDVGRGVAEMAAVATASFIAAGAATATMYRPVQELKFAGESLAISIGTVVAPAMRKAGETLRTIAAYINGLSPDAKALAVKILEIAGALGLILTVGAKVAEVVGGLANVASFATSVFGAMGAAILPLLPEILLVLAALAGIAVTVVLVRAAWDSNFLHMRDVVEAVVNWHKQAFADLARVIQNIWGSVVGALKDAWSLFTEGFIFDAQLIGKAVQGLLDLVSKFLSANGQLLSAVGNATGVDFFKNAGKSLTSGSESIDKIGGTKDSVDGFFAELEHRLVEMKSGDFSSITKPAQGLLESLSGMAAGLKDSAAKEFASVFEQLKDLIAGLMPKKGVVPISDEERDFHKSFTVKAQQEAVLAAAGEQTKAAKAAIRALYDIAEAAELVSHRLGVAADPHRAVGELALSAAGANKALGRGLLGRSVTEGAPDETGRITSLISAVTDRLPQLGFALETAREALMSFGTYTRDVLPAVLGQAGQSFVGKLGNLGSTISAGISGGQAGGPWGAAIGVLLDFFEQADQFKKIVTTANGQLLYALKALSPALDAITSALQEFMGGLQPLTDALHVLAGSAFSQLANWLRALEPIVQVLGQIFAAITPILQMLINTLTPITPVFQLLFYALKGIGVVVAAVVLGIGEIWNQILALIVDVILAIQDATGADLHDFHNTIANMAIDTQGAADALNQLATQSWDNAKAAGEAAGAQYEAAGAAQAAADKLGEFREELTNVPAGYKVQAARFNSTQTTDGANGYGFGMGSNPIYIETVNVNPGAGDIWKQVNDVSRKRNFQFGGTPVSKGGKKF
ncbi:MAG: hypothetical protein QM723_34365 [Myxococcaceae bacterium]